MDAFLAKGEGVVLQGFKTFGFEMIKFTTFNLTIKRRGLPKLWWGVRSAGSLKKRGTPKKIFAHVSQIS